MAKKASAFDYKNWEDFILEGVASVVGIADVQVAQRFVTDKQVKEKLAAELNLEVARIFARIAENISGNFKGAQDRKYKRVKFGYRGKELTQNYQAWKKDKFGHPSPSYFKASGKLAEEIGSVVLPKVTPEKIKVEKVGARRGLDKRGIMHEFRDRGRGGRFIITSHWQVTVDLPPAYNPVDRQQERQLFSEGSPELYKLLNLPSKRNRGIYRPLVPAYFRWYQDFKVPDLIRKYYGNLK